MSLASWFRLPKFRFASALRPLTQRRPFRSRLRVEQLENRMLLAASVNNVPTLDNSAATFNTQQIGLTPPQVNQLQNPIAVTQTVNGAQFPILNGVAIGAQANLLAQSQLYDQFRAFGVNSQGQGNEFPTMQWLYAQTAMGFGSGTQPNAPWMPAAYNLGLANRQFNYSSQSDLGFSATPPWFRPTAQSLPQEQPLDADQMTESLLLHLPKDDRVQDEPRWSDEKALDNSEKEIAPTEQPVEEQTEPDEAAPPATRGDPATEEALFTDPLHTLTAAVLANQQDHAAPRFPNAKHILVEEAKSADGRDAEESAIPSSLWISALAPAQMAALVAGLPGVGAPADGADVGSSAGSAE